jgi:VanZ family protein
VFVWALLDEVTKIPIRGRHFSWLDVGLNLGGAALGMVLWLLV